MHSEKSSMLMASMRVSIRLSIIRLKQMHRDTAVSRTITQTLQSIAVAGFLLLLTLVSGAPRTMAFAAAAPPPSPSSAAPSASEEAPLKGEQARAQQTASEIAVLYEEDESTPTGRGFEGFVTWRLERIVAADGQPGVAAVVAQSWSPTAT
jgi:hypothetical protein